MITRASGRSCDIIGDIIIIIIVVLGISSKVGLL